MQNQPLFFVKNNRVVRVDNIPHDRMLLDFIREDLGLKGSKEGCGEGDCGACTVVLGQLDANDQLQIKPVNACIRFAHSIAGQVLFTVEDLRQSQGSLHPCQQAMVDHHGSQCGFCTPGFVMSLFAMYERHTIAGQAIDRSMAVEGLSGNLCRCTGYRPILDAACTMDRYAPAGIDRAALTNLLKEVRTQRTQHARAEALASDPVKQAAPFYVHPNSLQEALAWRAAHPDALVVGGSTDVGLWVNKLHHHYPKLLDLSQVPELSRMQKTADRLRIGAAAPLSQAFELLIQHYPELHEYCSRYAGLPIRESATLGGNIANGSPIGDSMPMLIALGATVQVANAQASRAVPIEDFYRGYRQSVLAPNELITAVDIPLRAFDLLSAMKLSKRFDDDISIVSLVVAAELRAGTVASIRIGVGGMAATPVRAKSVEDWLTHKAWSFENLQAAGQMLSAEFSPISDMRASSAYRQQVIAEMLTSCWHAWSDKQGQTVV